VIAATNKNLAHEVREGRFREDLYYRLNVISIFLPPLRERIDDVPRLVEHFLHKHRYNPGAAPARIMPQAMDALMEHDWPGNVRELENIIERAVVLAQGSVITEDHIRFSSADQRHFVDVAEKVRKGTPIPEVLNEVEQKMLLEALGQSSGDRVAAAALLGLELKDLQQKLSDYGITVDRESVSI
jgi:two-component system, NtrC family, response regulator AtoC